MILQCAEKAVKDLRAPGLPILLLYSFLLSLLVLISFVSLSSWGMAKIPLEEYGFSPGWVALLTGIVSSIIGWMLFPVVMPVIVSFFDEHIAERIEKYDYPAIPIGQSMPFWADFWHDVRFSIKAIFLNILCLPLYLIPGLNLILFYLLNGYLLGTQFFTMAGGRHVGKVEANQIRKKNRMPVLLGGMLITLLGTIPLINLIAPFWGIALMIHLFHQLKNK